MGMKFHALLSFVWWWTVCVANAEPKCTASTNTNFKYSVFSRRNLSGHWISQVELQQDKGKYSGPLDLEIEHSTRKCEAGEAFVVTASLSAPPEPPGPGYVLMPGLGHYKYHEVGKRWEDAVEACAAEGAYLQIPNSEAEFQAVKKIWDLHPSRYTDWRKNHFYIGLSDKAKEGQWLTIFGQPINETGYTKWGASQPNGGVAEDCLLLTFDGSLHDVGCSAEVSFMCERGI